MYLMRDTVNHTVITGDFYGKQAPGDHFVMYRNTESLHCTPETNSVLGQLYFNNNKKNGNYMRSWMC